jgi:hypothetical protein
MIHRATSLTKFKKLQRRLGFEKRREVIGLLECLWLFTQREAPCGDVGRFDDETIAIELEWDGNPTDLISSLAETGWLDKCGKHRLIVHDWPEHAPRYVHAQLKSRGWQFATKVSTEPSTEPSTDSPVEHSVEPPVERSVGWGTKPNLTKPLELPTEACPEVPSEPASEFSFETKHTKADQSGIWWLPQKELDRYVAVYGQQLDVPDELRRAAQWIHANSTQRKTPNGMLSFLTRWMNKSSDRPSKVAPTTLSEFDAARTPEAVAKIRF